MDLNKKDVIRLLETIVTYLQLKGENPFRIRAYERAAQSLERDVRSLNEIDDFTSISGIGQGTNDLIVEFIETGKSKLLEELKETIPAGLIPLLQVPGLGGKRLATLYKEINVTDAASLRAVCKSGEIKTVRGFGDKTVENILSALEKSGSRPERLPIALMLDISE